MRNAVRVLCVGHDRLLLQTRKMVLARHYSVDIATTLDELGSSSAAEHVALVVLCHSLSRQERVLAARMVKRLWPQARLLEVLSGRENQPASEDSECLLGLDGPAALLEKAASLLYSQPHTELVPLVRRPGLVPVGATDIEDLRNFFSGHPV